MSLVRQQLASGTGQTHYRVWSRISMDSFATGQQARNERFQRIQGAELLDHYTIRLGAGGSLPVTHVGSAGVIEAREAESILSFYDAQTVDQFDAWLLDLAGNLLWTKTGGDVARGAVADSYVADFLAATTPAGLQPVPAEEVGEDFSAIVYALTPNDQAPAVWAKLCPCACLPELHPFGLDGKDKAATHQAATFVVHSECLPEIRREFPPMVGRPADVITLDIEQRITWNNDTGDIAGRPKLPVRNWLDDENLEPVKPRNGRPIHVNSR